MKNTNGSDLPPGGGKRQMLDSGLILRQEGCRPEMPAPSTEVTRGGPSVVPGFPPRTVALPGRGIWLNWLAQRLGASG